MTAKRTRDPTFDANAHRQLGLGAAIASLGFIFWIVGAMEMVERLAFYGVKAVAALYATAPRVEGGLGVTASIFGDVLMVWAFTQSLLPVLVGGLADRFGYKRTIFISTIVKISGYLVMAWLPTYMGFLLGAVLLATGTAIFKPAIQGTLVHATKPENSSVAWGFFYQLVNVGGWIGPLLAAYLRSRLSWTSVFYACSGIIACNFILLLTYREPKLSAAPVGQASTSLWRVSVQELRQIHVWAYLAAFTGFWFMFNALFDVLPLHVRDWVDTNQLVRFFFSAGKVTNPTAKFLLGSSPDGSRILPEGMLNINAGLIMTTCFFVAYLGSKLRATTSMIVGTWFAIIAMLMTGFSVVGTVSALAICVFSVGEMLSSPKFNEFMGNIAPRDKTAMYLGFSQIPLAIGWTLEGKLGPMLYDRLASKERFARQMLQERGMARIQIDQIPEGEAFSRLVAFTQSSAANLTRLLYERHSVGTVWIIMAVFGLASVLGLSLYARFVLGRSRNPSSIST
jgi:proton-dependent oligopeptide transporter, POT family